MEPSRAKLNTILDNNGGSGTNGKTNEKWPVLTFSDRLDGRQGLS
jgi:hypothetical protein